MILAAIFLVGTFALQAVDTVRCRVVRKVSPARLSMELTTISTFRQNEYPGAAPGKSLICRPASYVCDTCRRPPQVQQEAVRVDRSVNVDPRDLRLSSPELQDQFYDWMDDMREVRWFPWFHLVTALGMGLKILDRDGSGWLHVVVCLPGPILAGARLALQMNGCSKQAQSLASTLHASYINSLVPIMMALGDPCFGSIGPSLTSSPAKAAAFSATLLLHFHAATPCTMRHHLVFCCITGLGNVISVYIRYLRHNGGLSDKSDPFGIAFFAITCSTLASLALAAILRLYLTQFLMVKFFRSARP